MNKDRASDNGDVGKSVAEIVEENAAHVEIAAGIDEGQSDSAVDGKRGERGPDHPAFDNGDRRTEALDGFIAEPSGEQYQNEGIGVSGESAGAMVAEGFFPVGRALGPTHGQVGEANGGYVGKIVDCVI